MADDKVATSTRQKLDSCFVCGGERRKISREPSVLSCKKWEMKTYQTSQTLLLHSLNMQYKQNQFADYLRGYLPHKKSRNLSMMAINEATDKNKKTPQ